MSSGTVKFTLIDDPPADSEVWKSWQRLICDEEWATDDRSTTCLGPQLSNTKSVFAVIEVDNSYMGSVVWNEYHDQKLAWIGFFNVEQKYRGMGIGLEAWKRAIDRIPKDYTLGLKAVTTMLEKYKSRDVPIEGPNYTKYKLVDAEKVAEICQKRIIIDTSKLRINNVTLLNEQDWTKIKEFDREISGQNREEWLKMYRNFVDAYSVAIFDEKNQVVCYASLVTTCHNHLNRYKLAPVYARDLQYALIAIQNLSEWVKIHNPKAEIALFMVEGTIGQNELHPIFMEEGLEPLVNGSTLFSRPYNNTTDFSKVYIPYNNPCCFDI